MRPIDPQLISAFADLAEHTRPKCAQCRSPFSCCSAANCHATMELARITFGVNLEQTGHSALPLMGPEGCTAAPHLRPLCAVHVCEAHLLPAPEGTEAATWQDRYWELRDSCEEALFEHETAKQAQLQV